MSSVEFNCLSRLPDSILTKILSFLPARDAARTVLLRTFGYRWTNIDRLNFDDHFFVVGQNNNNLNKAFGTLKFVRFVRNFLMLHQCSKICSFKLSFSYMFETVISGAYGGFDEREKWKIMNEVEMWIKYAFTRGVEELDLVLGTSTITEQKFKIPEFVWTSDSLTQLRLVNCEVNCPKKAWMGLLKIITLNFVNISNEALSELIGCCPLLQDLRIIDCIGLTTLSFIAPNIKNLQVCMNLCQWKLMVNCPNLRSFDFSGYVDFVELVNLSLVKKVTFSLKLDFTNKFKAELQYKRFLDKVQHADILILDKVAFSVLTYRVLQNHPCPRNTWKCIVLHTWLSKSFIRALCSMLRYSSSLEELIIHIDDRTDYLLKGVVLVNESEGDAYTRFDDDDWSFQCLRQSLKNVTMHGLLSSSSNAQLDLARIILKNGLVLDKLVIFGEANDRSLEKGWLTSGKLSEISQKLQAFPRASEHTSVYLLYPVITTTMPVYPVITEKVETKSKRKQQNSKRKRGRVSSA